MEVRPDCRRQPQVLNPFSETLSRDHIRDIQLKNLRRLIEYSRANCTLYRHRLKRIKANDIRTLEDVKQIPLLEKEDLRLAQDGKANFLFGDVLGIPADSVSHYRQNRPY